MNLRRVSAFYVYFNLTFLFLPFKNKGKGINRVDKTIVSPKPQNETKMTLLISTKDDLNSV